MMINAFPPKSGLKTEMSPRTIITGKSLDYKKHFKIPFGDYAQVHEFEQPRNSMKERTLGAICLGPLDNPNGGYKFFNLKTGKLIRRYAWDRIPIIQEVIDKVIAYGQAENMPSGCIIHNINEDIDFVMMNMMISKECITMTYNIIYTPKTPIKTSIKTYMKTKINKMRYHQIQVKILQKKLMMQLK